MPFPGVFPVGLFSGQGQAPLATLAPVASGTSTAANGAITASAPIQAGDLLVVAGSCSGSTSASLPPGFTTVLAVIDTATSKDGIGFKVADGSEGTTVTGFSAIGTTPGATNLLLVFRGNVPVGSVSANSPVTSGVTAANPAAQVVPAAAATPPLIVFAAYASSGAVDPRSMTPAKDGEINVGTNTYLAYKIYNSSPANVTVDMDDEGTNELSSFYLSCS
jgi:hypothetical protein